MGKHLLLLLLLATYTLQQGSDLPDDASATRSSSLGGASSSQSVPSELSGDRPPSPAASTSGPNRFSALIQPRMCYCKRNY